MMFDTKFLQRNLRKCVMLSIILIALSSSLIIIASYSDFTELFRSALGLQSYLIMKNIETIFTDNDTGKFNANYTFQEVTGPNIYSFYNVCVEGSNVVIYRGLPGHHNLTFQRSQISVRAARKTFLTQWDLLFTNASVPATHKLLPTTAFFLTETFRNNLWHVWNDVFIEIFSVVREANRLHPGMHNQILYRYPGGQSNPNDLVCKSCQRSPYDIFQHTLYTTNQFFVYSALPTNTCFSSAVFGTRYNGTRIRDTVDNVLNGLNLSYKPLSKDKSVLFIKRRNRCILNIHDLAKEAQRIGFKTVKVIDLETMTVLDQIKLIIDTDILIGAQGAGLQWGTFMRAQSTVIEISWPEKHWHSWYSFVRDYLINFVKFETNQVFVNWIQFETLWRKGIVGPDERARLLISTPPNAWDNIWKYADVTVNVTHFHGVLEKLR